MSESNSSKRDNSRRINRRNPPKCRRNLFGKCSKESADDLEREVQKIQKQQAIAFQQAWNFDPITTQPLPGKFEWTIAGKVPLRSGAGLLSLPSLSDGSEDSSSGFSSQGDSEMNRESSARLSAGNGSRNRKPESSPSMRSPGSYPVAKRKRFDNGIGESAYNYI